MMKNAFIILICKNVILFAVIGISAGCSEDSASEITSLEIQPPEILEINGINWRREDSLGVSDSNLLSRYFELNPSMGDSPILAGIPTVYHGTKNRRRFFWIKGTVSEPIWICVYFAKGKFQLLEGQGNPYQNNSQ